MSEAEKDPRAPAAGSPKHTPGPWSPYAALGHMYVHGPDGEELAEVAPWGPAANCILMAAAPALADALAEYVAEVDRKGWPSAEWSDANLERMRAALRAAGRRT